MLKKTLGLLALLVLGFLAFVSTRPDEVHVERSTTINASPDAVFAHLSDFHQWEKWSPWEGLDPAMTKEFGGPATGTGSTYSWSGNNLVGKGRMTVEDVQSPTVINYRLEFLAPWQSVSETGFRLDAVEGGTRVKWLMDTEQNFGAKLAGVFMDMDAMVGTDFEKGLTNLKGIVEAEPAPVVVPEVVAVPSEIGSGVGSGAGFLAGSGASAPPAPVAGAGSGAGAQ